MTGYTHYVFLIQAAATVVAFSLVHVIARKKSIPGWYFFSMGMSAVGFWSLANALEFQAATFGEKVFWSKISYLGITTCAPLWFMFILRYTGHDRWLTRRVRLAWWTIPAVISLLALTNDHHGLIWPSVRPIYDSFGFRVQYDHGIGVWVAMAYSYLFLAISYVILIRWSFVTRSLSRRQTVFILMAIFAPWLGNIVYMTGLFPVPGLDLTPIAFTLTGVLFAWTIFHYKLLDLVPVAYDSLVGLMRNGVFAIDNEKRLALMNPAARAMLGVRPDSVGVSLDSFFPGALPDDDAVIEIPGPVKDGPEWLEVTATTLRDGKNLVLGRLVTISDITDYKRNEREKEILIRSLEKNLSEIKQLRGLLPICSHCKKVRTDDGYWHQIEKYVSAHTDASFTHGVCPDCMETYYAGIIRKDAGEE